MERVFFCNSGAEAVESALKFARYATGKSRIIYCHHGFHGLTTGSLSVNGAEEFRTGFGPLLADVEIPLGDLGALEAALREGDVAAMIVEPIQGHGVAIPPPGFLPAAQAMLHQHDALLICDEVQSGFGRTGDFFAYQHDNVEPDIVTVAKALSGGYVPVGATLAKGWIIEKVFSIDGPGDRPLDHVQGRHAGDGRRAGLAGGLEDEGLAENAARTGAALNAGLEELAQQLRGARRRARPRADDRDGVRQAERAHGAYPVERAAEGTRRPVRPDGRRRAVPAAPHPDPGLRRPHGGR